mgnify:FL=1
MSKRTFWEALKSAFANEPQEVKAQESLLCIHFARWCWKYIYAMLDIKLPEDWDKGYFLRQLYTENGLLGVSDTVLGIIPLRCSAVGVNVWNHPTDLLFAPPTINSFQKKIDVDCVPIYVDEDCLENSISPFVVMVNYYSQLLAQCIGTISVNLMNSRIAIIAESDSKQDSATIKSIMNDIYNGKPATFTKKGIASNVNFVQAKNTYVSNEIHDLMRAIRNDFLSELGYNNTNYNKKARQTISEVESNNAEIIGGVTYWYETLKEQFDKANKMFGLKLSVKMRPWHEVQEMVGDVD